MYTICVILLVFCGLVFVWHLLTRKYLSPYTFTLIFGKKGVGKSLSMQKDLLKHKKRGWHCFADSNTDLEFVRLIDCRKIYSYKFPRNSLVCIDEINLLWDNRDFKSFEKPVQDWFRQQRKRGVKIIAYSQTFDCDKKLRDLSDRLAVQRKFLRVFTLRRYYVKTPRVISAEDARDTSRIVDDYVKVPVIFRGIDLTYIPRYCRYYHTDEIKGDISTVSLKTPPAGVSTSKTPTP